MYSLHKPYFQLPRKPNNTTKGRLITCGPKERNTRQLHISLYSAFISSVACLCLSECFMAFNGTLQLGEIFVLLSVVLHLPQSCQPVTWQPNSFHWDTFFRLNFQKNKNRKWDWVQFWWPLTISSICKHLKKKKKKKKKYSLKVKCHSEGVRSWGKIRFTWGQEANLVDC